MPPPSFREDPPSSRIPSGDSALIEEVAAAAGLSRIVGRPALERAIRRAGVNPLRLTPLTLGRALPEIEQVLRAFLSPETAETRLAAIARLARL